MTVPVLDMVVPSHALTVNLWSALQAVAAALRTDSCMQAIRVYHAVNVFSSRNNKGCLNIAYKVNSFIIV